MWTDTLFACQSKNFPGLFEKYNNKQYQHPDPCYYLAHRKNKISLILTFSISHSVNTIPYEQNRKEYTYYIPDSVVTFHITLPWLYSLTVMGSTYLG